MHMHTLDSKLLELHPERLAVSHLGFMFELSPHIVNLVANIFVTSGSLRIQERSSRQPLTLITDPP